MKRKVFVLGVCGLVAATACPVRGQQTDEPMVCLELNRGPGSVYVNFLCEWHYPATKDETAHTIVCYEAGYLTQCYRIEGDRVTDYHSNKKCDLRLKIEEIIGSNVRHSDRDTLIVAASNLYYQENWSSYAAREAEARARPFEAGGLGYVLVLTWKWAPIGSREMDAGISNPGKWAVAVCPLGEESPVVKVLRDAVDVFMADPSTREHHTAYVRAYPVLSPERPDRIPMLEGGKWFHDFHWQQRHVLRFIPSMDRMLIPIEKYVNPFEGFGTPFTPGSSLTLNYRHKGKDWFWYLNGDNFWRIEVYGGDEE